MLARSHGLAALRALVGAKHEIALVTPRYEPGSVVERLDLLLFVKVGQTTTDLRIAEGNAEVTIREACRGADLLVSVNWRHKVPSDILALPKYGGVNLHRGRLPEYAGARPVERAIAAGETLAYLTAHHMTDVIDGGPVLVEAAVTCRSGPDAVQATIDAMEPYVGPLLMEALAMIEKEAHADR